MGFGSVLWNFTEYLCYLSIIVFAAKEIGIFRFLKKSNGKEEDETEASGDGTLNRALDMLKGVIQNVQSSDGPISKKSTPASRRRK